MRYQTFPPPAELADIVEHFWAVENPVALDRHREILVPNGRPTLLVCLGQAGVRLAPDALPLDNASNIAGPLTRPIVLEQSGVSSYAAAQLHPWGLSAFSSGTLVDAILPMDKFVGSAEVSRLSTSCREAPFGPSRVAPIADLLMGLRKPLALRRIREAVEIVDAEGGQIDVGDLTGAMGIGYDALYRLFKAMTGLSPKQYIGIIRHYHFTGVLLKGEFGSLALLANMEGYYDQAHAAKEFKRFTGVGQAEFKRRLNGIAQLMHKK
ncbi:helix-turn-helix domain-containing protein [Pelagibacterium sp.]|uniref:helix-turn-helix domain-containing protein n=1 Tax=Pelagibacterium sp. TaxID=1967288 RepID=UPI003BAC2905